MRLAVVGSRGFQDPKRMERELARYLPDATLLISGGAKGADRLAERWARKNNIERDVKYPDHKRYKHPYHHRNRLIAEACDQLVAFWDGKSTGTKYTVDYAKRIGKPVNVIRF